jgi:hypothetical protein
MIAVNGVEILNLKRIPTEGSQRIGYNYYYQHVITNAVPSFPTRFPENRLFMNPMRARREVIAGDACSRM